MGVRENKIEKYLNQRFVELGGDTRKWVSPGHDGVPDQLCAHPEHPIVAVEVKTFDGVLADYQSREQTRLRKIGIRVVTVYGYLGVDKLVKDYLKDKPLQPGYR